MMWLYMYMQLLKNMKKQFCGLLYDTGFIHSPDPENDEANHNSADTKLVKAVLCAGLYPNVAKIVQNRADRWEGGCICGTCIVLYM